MIEYKGYVGVYEFDEKNNLLYGKVSNIDDLVTFQGKSIKQIQEAFEDAVNEYIAWCKKYRSPAKKYRSLLKEKETGGGGL